MERAKAFAGPRIVVGYTERIHDEFKVPVSEALFGFFDVLFIYKQKSSLQTRAVFTPVPCSAQILAVKFGRLCR